MAIWQKVMQWKWYCHTIMQLSLVLFLAHSSLGCPWHGTNFGILRKVCWYGSLVLSETCHFPISQPVESISIWQHDYIYIFCLTDSNWCTWKRCPAPLINSATDKIVMHTSHLPAALYSSIPICKSATTSLSDFGSSVIDWKWHNRSHNRGTGKVQTRNACQC